MTNYTPHYSSQKPPDKSFKFWLYTFCIISSIILTVVVSNIYSSPNSSQSTDTTSSDDAASSSSSPSSSSSSYDSSPSPSAPSSSSSSSSSANSSSNSSSSPDSASSSSPNTTQSTTRPSVTSQKTPSGLSYSTALNLCEKRLENQYGYELNSVDAEEIRNDTWYFELEGFYEGNYYWSIDVATCIVSGTESSPHITSFSEDEYDRSYFDDDGDYYDYEDYY